MDLLKNLNSNSENNGDNDDDDDDEDDEDYVPEEDEGDDDDPSEKDDDEEEANEKGVKRKVSGDDRTEPKKDSEETKEAKKKRADDLWADLCSTDSTEKSSCSSSSVSKPVTAASTVSSFKSRSGLQNLVSGLGKKSKMNLIEKTKLDWQNFKQEEDLEHELKQHTLSKNRYTDKQAFLLRADLRQFEIEKGIRDKSRLKK